MILSNKIYKIIINAIVLITMALLFLSTCNNQVERKELIIYNYESGEQLANYPIGANEHFYIKFNHSVNMSPVIDYYRFDTYNNIYVYKTVYYNYGAGVETELENNESLSFNDGAMIISNIDKKIEPLTYYLSNIYDHKLSINDQEEISLWDICGKNILINIIIK